MTELQPNVLTLNYAGVSHYTLEEDGTQRVCLFTDQNRPSAPAELLKLQDPLGFRAGLKTLLELAGLRGAYQPADAEIYQAYADWRRGLNPTLSPVELTTAFFSFLSEHDPQAWVGCDPTLTLDASGLSIELLDPSGRVYGALTIPNHAFERVHKEGDTLTPVQDALVARTAQFEGGVSLREGLGRLNSGTSALLSVGASATEAAKGYCGSLQKVLPAPENWQRNYTQLLAASTLNSRRVPLSRMDLYNVLQQLRLHADPPKQKNGVRFELVPGKPPALTLEPWGWRLVGTGGVYRGRRAELIGIWDRRDLLVFDALLPYIQSVEAVILGEAQPTYWVLDCGSFSFTLAVMGFRPNNWSRGLLLDISLPRQAPTEVENKVLNRLKGSTHTLDELIAQLSFGEAELKQMLRSLIQAGELRPQLILGEAKPRFQARSLFTSYDCTQGLYRNDREAHAHYLVGQNRVLLSQSELPTGEVEIKGEVTEPKAPHMATEPTYAPQFQLKEGAGMRKLSCDCAWMKDREKAKSGPCSHAQALWLRYALDEEARLAELALHPERVERATSVYVRRSGDQEQSRQVNFNKKRIDELWEGTGESSRRFHKIFNSIEAARAAYFQRIADLERRDYMDASQS